MKYTESDLKIIHDHCYLNRKEIVKSKRVTCLFCTRVFGPADVKEWIDDSTTAVCPYCSVDSVVGDNIGYRLDKKLLASVYKYWFN